MNVKGFHVNFLGDSITYGVGVSDIPNCRYDNRIANMLGLSRVSNHSINGSRLAHQTVPSAKPWYDLCFCGGVYYLMQYLRETYKDKPIIFMTPARCFLRHEVDDLYPSVHAAKRVPGKPLKAYADAILETAKMFDVKVLDLYNDLGVDPHIPEHFETYTTDGLHFNDEGHALIAQKLKALIESIETKSE